MTHRDTLYNIIFEADTPAGKWFDVALIVSILLSVVVVMLDSVSGIRLQHGPLLLRLEWIFTILFSVEYGMRIYSARRAFKYVSSFYGIIDLLAILPSFISLILPATQYLSVVRILRVLRVFRVLKLVPYLHEYTLLIASLRASRRKIMVFLLGVVTLVIILGSIIYVIEPSEAGFTSIPHCIYWAIVTMTTVGYGDITPTTSLGKAISGCVMILGYCIIALPAGLVTTEMINMSKNPSTQVCMDCMREGHDQDAAFCKFCGSKIT